MSSFSPISGSGTISSLPDGSSVSPSLNFTNASNLGIYLTSSNTTGFTTGLGTVAMEVGDLTITNTDPISPATVKTNSRFYPASIVGGVESCGMYILVHHSTSDHTIGIYGEVDTGQSFWGGGFTKCITRGMGDAHYVALMRHIDVLPPADPSDMGGLGYEAATWSHRSCGFLSSCQRTGLTGWKGFDALWEQDTLIDYGAFYASGCPNRSFIARKRNESVQGMFNGYYQFGIEEWDLSRLRWAVYNDGETHWKSLDATAGSTIKDAPGLHLIGSYYTGGAAHDKDAVIKHIVTSNTGTSELRISIGNYGADATKLIIQDSGTLDLQSNPTIACGGITMRLGGANLDLQTGSVVSCGAIVTPDATYAIQVGDNGCIWTEDSCYYHARIDSSDDWDILFDPVTGIAPACVLAGKILILMPGTYHCNSIQSVPAGLYLIASPDVHIIAALTPTGVPPYPSVFRHNGINEASIATTLNSAGVIGSLTISTTDNIAVNSEIWIQDSTNTNQAASYIVVATTGGAPATLTLDRPLKRNFTNGSGVQIIVRANDITLDGRGASISGTFDRVFNFPAANNVRIVDWNIDATLDSTEYACSIDTASYASGFERIRVNSGPATALALEGCEDCWAEDCHIVHHGTVARNNCGILLQAVVDTELRNCHSSGRTGASGAGILIGWLTDTVACRGVRLIGCSFVGCLNGVQVAGGSNDVDLIGCNISNNTNYGVYCATAITPTRLPGRIKILGGEIKNNGAIGFYADGTIGHKIIGTYIYENIGNIATNNGGEITIIGIESYNSETGSGYHVKTSHANDVILISDSTLRGTNTGFGYGCWVAAGYLKATGIRFDFANGGMIAVVQTGGSCYLSDWYNIGATIGNGYISTAGIVKRGPNCSFANCSAPWTIGVAGTANFGIITLNEATPVTLPFTPTIASDIVMATRIGIAGTAAPFQAVPSAGVGAVLTGTAGDTSTISVWIL